jgi:hypothetical protein
MPLATSEFLIFVSFISFSFYVISFFSRLLFYNYIGFILIRSLNPIHLLFIGIARSWPDCLQPIYLIYTLCPTLIYLSTPHLHTHATERDLGPIVFNPSTSYTPYAQRSSIYPHPTHTLMQQSEIFARLSSTHLPQIHLIPNTLIHLSTPHSRTHATERDLGPIVFNPSTSDTPYAQRSSIYPHPTHALMQQSEILARLSSTHLPHIHLMPNAHPSIHTPLTH